MSEEKNEFAKALKKTADYLAQRSHSQKELEDKLTKEFSFSVIERVIKQAQENGWLETAEELSQKVVESLNHKNKSWNYIKRYCYEKGLPLPQYNKDKELEKAGKILLKKTHSLAELSEKDKFKLKRFLAYRGFEQDVVDDIFS